MGLFFVVIGVVQPLVDKSHSFLAEVQTMAINLFSRTPPKRILVVIPSLVRDDNAMTVYLFL